jgi:hypothetical protein
MAAIRSDCQLNIESLCAAAHLAAVTRYPPRTDEQRSAKMQPKFANTRHIPDGRPAACYRTTTSRQQPVIARIERIAGRVTEGIIALAPVFWLALFFMFIAVSLGVIPNQ